MKKYLSLILIIMLAISLCACGQKEPASQPNNSGAQDKQEGTVVIEITPPEGWKSVEGSVLPVQYMNGTASFMVKEEHFSSSNLDDVANEALGIYKNSFDNLKVQGEIEPITVDEKDARQLTFTCTVGKINMKYLYVYVFAADKTYVITFGDQVKTFDKLADDYETILNNISFTTK